MGQFKKGVFSAEISVLISVFSCKDYRLQNMISSHLQIKRDFMKTKEKNPNSSHLSILAITNERRTKSVYCIVVELWDNYGNE